MTDDTETVQVSHLVPKSARETAQAKTDHGELSEKVRSLYETIAFGEELGERSQIERELRSVREQKDEKRSEIRQLQADVESLEKRESRLEERLSEMSSREDKYEGAIEMLEEQIYDGQNVFPGHTGVQRAAGLADVEPEGVIQTLKDRNPNVPDHVYKQKLHTNKKWRGCSEEYARGEQNE